MRALATSLVLASAAVLAFSDGAVAGRKSTLAPGASSSDADAAGEMRLIRRGRRAAALQVRVRNLDPNSLYGVRATQGGGRIGDVPTNRRGRGRVRFGSKELPGGAASMVSGMALEVFHEESGEVVLTGDVPHEGNHDGDGHDGDATAVREAAAVFEADGGIRAVMSLRSDPDHGSERMALRASGMGPDGEYSVFLARGDSMEKVGSLEAHEGEKHCERRVDGEHVVETCTWTENWQWMVDTADGDGLPFDEASLDALVGHRFEIHDHEGHVLLHGEVPHFHEEETPPPHDGGDDTPPAVHETGADFSGDGDAHARVDLRTDPAHHSERMAVKISGLGLDGHFVLFVANGEGVMDDVAVLTVDGGFLWYYRDTIHDGQRLPFNVERVAALSGRRFEIRDAEGHVRIHGEIPRFAD